MLYYSKNKEHRENSVTKYVYRPLYWASGVALDQAATLCKSAAQKPLELCTNTIGLPVQKWLFCGFSALAFSLRAKWLVTTACV